MAVTQVQPEMVVYKDGSVHVLRKLEFLIGSAADLSSIPDCAPGSVAYTADLSYMAMFDGTEWVQIGGGD